MNRATSRHADTVVAKLPRLAAGYDRRGRVMPQMMGVGSLGVQPSAQASINWRPCVGAVFSAVTTCGAYAVNEAIRISAGQSATSPTGVESIDKLFNSLAGPCVGSLVAMAYTCGITPIYDAYQRWRATNAEPTEATALL